MPLSEAEELELLQLEKEKAMAESAPKAHEPEGWGTTIARGALETLPTLGMMAGGALGAPAGGGVGAIPGAALGYAGGKQLERLGKQYLLGDKEDNVPSKPLEQATQVATDLGEGVMAEMGGQAAGKALSKVGGYIADKLRKTGVRAAIRHLRPTPNTARGLGPEKLSEIGEEALQSGAIRPFQKVGTTAENLSNLASQAGQVKSDIVKGSSATINPADLSARVQKNVIDPLEQTTAGKRVAGTVRNRLGELMGDLGEGAVPAARIEAEKTAEQQGINWLTAPKAEVGAMQGYTSQLRQAVEDAMGNDPAFLAAKRSYGNLKEGAKMASRSAGLTDGGTGLMGHIGDVGAVMEGVEGLATGNPVKMATPVARALTKGRVASTVATGAYGAGKAVQGATKYASPVAKAISSRVTQSLKPLSSVQQDLLRQQSDPDAQEELKQSQE